MHCFFVHANRSSRIQSFRKFAVQHFSHTIIFSCSNSVIFCIIFYSIQSNIHSLLHFCTANLRFQTYFIIVISLLHLLQFLCVWRLLHALSDKNNFSFLLQNHIPIARIIQRLSQMMEMNKRDLVSYISSIDPLQAQFHHLWNCISSKKKQDLDNNTWKHSTLVNCIALFL